MRLTRVKYLRYNWPMLVIGHRGAAGLAPENTLAALQAGVDAGADILEFDVRLTSDGVPVLAHNPRLAGKWLSQTTLAELQQATTVTTLQEVLDVFFGKILLNIEIKQTKSVPAVCEAIKLYITRDSDWDNILFSSFKPQALVLLRENGDELNLALLHHINPFTYMRYHKKLNLSAVGFHRLHINSIALAVAKELGIFTYVYTVDLPKTALRMEQRGLDGVVTNYPNKLNDALTPKA